MQMVDVAALQAATTMTALRVALVGATVEIDDVLEVCVVRVTTAYRAALAAQRMGELAEALAAVTGQDGLRITVEAGNV